MRTKVDFKNKLEISGLRNSASPTTEIEKIRERAILGEQY